MIHARPLGSFAKDQDIAAMALVACTTMEDLIHPRAWAERSTGMPVLPGGRSAWLSTLRALIEEVSATRGPASSDQAPLPQAGGLNRHQLQRLVRAGLLSREGPAFLPSTAALTWYQSGDPAVLVQAFHCNVRFVGEAMGALVSGPRTHEQLLDLARGEFDLRWDTPAPVRDRTSWLAVTGMVELFDRHVHLTEAGRGVLAGIALGRPEFEGADTAVHLAPAAKAVAQLIEQLDGAALRGGQTVRISTFRGPPPRAQRWMHFRCSPRRPYRRSVTRTSFDSCRTPSPGPRRRPRHVRPRTP